MDTGIAFAPFDLFAGLTVQEVETLAATSNLFAFVFLIACLWLVRALTRP